jgi:apolipoprotein N-acyltransferase
MPWIVLGVRRELGGRRPYRSMWLAGFVFWLAALHWLTLPYWATAFGWLLLSAYLAVYWPLFVALLRVAVRLRLPSIVAAPLVWTGLELAQAHLLGGFLMGSLAHTQYRQLPLIQISDLGGSYAVTFLVVWVAACLVRMLPLDGRRWSVWPAAPLAALLAGALVYGHVRLSDHAGVRPGPQVALIQGSIDTEMKADPGQSKEVLTQYFGLSERAVRENPGLDLIVWPETMFRYPWFLFDKDYVPTDPDAPSTTEIETRSREQVGRMVRELGTSALIGIETAHFRRTKLDRYNSALFVDRSGEARGRYDKVHLVMFGEYVPLADRFPWIYSLTPLAGGLSPGAGPLGVELGKVRYAANICYESTLPHLIRGQVRQLRETGEEPDVLVNLTNDGWFWGSSELDMHLACGVFRAVECRKPFLIAANTGFSAWIDADGRIVKRGPRRETGIVVADVQLDSRSSPYVACGDWPAGFCLSGCAALAIAGLGMRMGSARRVAPSVG